MGVQTQRVVSAQEADELQAWDAGHVIHPQFVPKDGSRARLIVEGKGTRLYDASGREYLDATGGLWLAQVGHGRSEIAEAARAQIERLEYFSSFWDYTNEPAVRLSQRLVEIAPNGLEGVFYTTGGSESNEMAILMARLFHARHGKPEKHVILSRHKGYHGITYGARTATGMDVFHQDVGPLPGGFVYLSAPEPYRMDNCTETCIAELESTIAEIGADRIAAMIGEPILGVGGMLPPPDDYWPRVSSLLREHGIFLILDEVVTGYGRTGTWFGAEQWGIEPDIVASAKGITSGYIPLGAVLVRAEILDAMLSDNGFVSGFTYTGHPTACAVALKNLEIIENEGLLENARVSGAYLLDRFRELLELPSVGDVRGCGLMLGIELVTDKETKEPAVELATTLGQRFTEETGVIIRNIANNLIFSPPLIFTTEECDQVAAAVELMVKRYAP